MSKEAKIIIGVLIALNLLILSFPNQSKQALASFLDIKQYAEDAAHTSGDNGLFPLAIRNDIATSTLTSATGDYGGLKIDLYNWLNVTPYAATTSIRLNELTTAFNAQGFNSASEKATSTVFDVSPYRHCQFLFTTESIGVSNHDLTFKLRIQSSVNTSDYMDYMNGFWGKFIFDDTAVSATTSRAVSFPCPVNPAVITAECNANCTASNLFLLENVEIKAGN